MVLHSAKFKLKELSNEDWKRMQILTELLLPFKEFTTLVGASSYPTLSTAYPLYSMLLRHMRGFSEDKDKVALVQPLFDSLRDNLATRFSQFPKIALLATMLDPRHKLMVPFTEKHKEEAFDLLKNGMNIIIIVIYIF